MALQVTDANFEELVNSGKPMVLDFWAEWSIVRTNGLALSNEEC